MPIKECSIFAPMDEITEEALLKAGFHKPFNLWLGPDPYCTWIAYHIRFQCWKIMTGPVTEYDGITTMTELTEKYQLLIERIRPS